MERLLRADIDPDGYRGFGHTTSLHLAACKGFTNIVQRLIDAGAKVESLDVNGATPLHLACLHGHLETVKTLMTAGGRSCLRMPYGTDGKTPVQLACDGGFTDMAEYLQNQMDGQ